MQFAKMPGGGRLVSIMTITFHCTYYRNVDTQSGMAPVLSQQASIAAVRSYFNTAIWLWGSQLHVGEGQTTTCCYPASFGEQLLLGTT